MEVYFVTTKNNIDELKKDFYSLRKWIKFPCDLTAKFKAQNVHKETEVAAVYYNKSDPQQSRPIVELADNFFKHHARDRKTILLHEIIHVCHHTNELAKYQHLLLVKKIQKFHSIMDRHVAKNGWDKKAKEMKIKLEIIRFAATLMFEMWNHLLFREKYSILFPRIMKLSATMTEDQFKRRKQEKFGRFYKYLLVCFLIRLGYLKKISGKQTFKKLDSLEKKIEKLLQDIMDKRELRVSKSLIMSNSDTEEYPLYEKIGKRYDKFLEQIWNEKLSMVK